MKNYFSIIIFISLLFSQQIREVANLKMENVPKIPSSIEQASRQYRNTRSASCRSWLPNGEGMIIGTRFGETSQLHLLNEPLGARNQITFFDEPVRGGYVCPNPDINGFLYSKDIGGNEFYQIYFYDFNNGKSKLLSDGTSRNMLGSWSNNGDYFSFSSNMGNGKDMNVFISDLKGNKKKLVVEDGYWFPRGWSPDDKKLIVGKYVSINESYIYIVDIETAEMTQFNAKKEKISYGGAQFSKNNEGIYYSSDEGTEFKHLRYFDISKGSHTVLTKEIPWDILGFSQSDNGRLIAFTTNENAITKLHVMKAFGFRELIIPELPKGSISGLKFHPDGNKIALNINASRTPGDIYVINLLSKKVEQWTKSEVGGLDTKLFSEPELITVKSFDSLKITGFLYEPSTKGPHPVVVYIHGGPESQYRPGFSSNIQYWVKELGIAVLATNVRGSSGFGKSFVKLDNGYLRENSVKDIGAFLDYIDADSNLDSDKIAVFGGSYGGYMVLSSMMHYNDRLRCAVDVVGISNFVTFLKNTKSYRRDLRRAEYGDERIPEMRKFLNKISPNNNAEKITKPIFIIQGYNDPRVPYTEAEQMRDIIRSNGGDVWYMVAMDEGHGFRKKFNRDYYTNAVSVFFKKYLKN